MSPKYVAWASFCCLAMAVSSGAAFAQGSEFSYPGQTPPMGKSCPSIGYAFRGFSATPIGYVWFGDASGISKVSGTADMKTGRFALTLTSLDGNGPTGTAEGEKDPHTGVVTAELKGPGCSNLKLIPMASIMYYQPAG